jgi:hypothetical protein
MTTPPPHDWLGEIEARLAAINGFEHQQRPALPFGWNALAELGDDGEWRTWDMKAPYSTEACVFIAAAPADIAALVARVRELERENAALCKRPTDGE